MLSAPDPLLRRWRSYNLLNSPALPRVGRTLPKRPAHKRLRLLTTPSRIACSESAQAVLHLNARSVQRVELNLTLLGDERVLELADADNFHLNNVPCLERRGIAVGAHPYDIAGIERQVAGHGANEGRDPEQHVVGSEVCRYFPVHSDRRFCSVEIKVGLDPRTHWFESVGVL